MRSSLLKAYAAQADDSGSVRFVTYTVQDGDSLYTICQANGLDYSTNGQMLMAINGIEDPDAIYVGQMLLIPTV